MERVLVALLLVFVHMLHGQWTDDFSDGDLSTDPVWTGDINDWTVVDNALQLNASDPGNSILRTQYALSSGMAVWEFSVGLDFAPSNNNFFECHFLSDNEIFSNGSGLFVRIGVNGSDDSIELWETVDGDESVLAIGESGLTARAPVARGIRITIDETGLIRLFSRENSAAPYFKEFEVQYEPLQENPGAWFHIFANYTSSNVDGFTLDNIKYADDTDDDAAALTSITVVDRDAISLQFNRSFDLGSSADIANYDIEGLTISSITPGDARSGIVELRFASEFINGRSYDLSYEVKDDVGAVISGTETFTALFGDIPERGDIVITEIMSDPIADESDFIEIYNNSAKIFDISAFQIDNLLGASVRAAIDTQYFLMPSTYLAITENQPETINRYNPISSAKLIENRLPAFANNSGNVSILFNDTLIDSVDYDVAWHQVLVRDPEGLSLERIQINGASNDSENWTSSASEGTPGYENSQGVVLDSPVDVLSITPETFSPDLDGRDDFTFITIGNVPSESIGTLKVWDIHGHCIRTLRNNALLSAGLAVRWDGLRDDGTTAAIGPYIVTLEYFTPSGETGAQKGTIILARELD